MSRALVTLNGKADRDRAVRLLINAATGTRVEFKQTKRSLDQNSKMWAALTDIASQVRWHGDKLRADDWKILFLDGLNRETRAVPGINGGFVKLGRSSSDLSKQEMSDLIELIHMFGAQHEVKFSDPESVSMRQMEPA